jgi:anti-sigma regulatory factor (Ser/Thr protein kinase)
VTPKRRLEGFLMHDSWRPDVVLTHKLELAADPYAVAAARKAVVELLRPHLGNQDLDDVAVLVSEVVTNAVRHGGARAGDAVVVHVALSGDVLRVEVCDQGSGFTPPTARQMRADGGGNGLILLERLATAWGVSGDDRTCVWFERQVEPHS